MRRWSEVFVFLAFVGFVTSMVAAAMKGAILMCFSFFHCSFVNGND
jgi:hypothetical protein